MKHSDGMLTFEVQLIPQGPRRWAALMGGQLLATDIKEPVRSEIARILLAGGADPRSMLTIRSGARIIASDLLGWAPGQPVTCADVDMIERD